MSAETSATAPAASEALLTIRDASVTYRTPGGGQLRAVDRVDLDVRPGEMLGLVGESGCGKSTLAKAICGLEPLSGGEIRFRGEPIRPLGLRTRPANQLRIQMVFQNPYASLNPRRTIGSQLGDGLRISTKRERWTVPGLLEAVELSPRDAERFPSQFSGGQRQRIAIARAIATGPDLLIGDEPISSLDASLQSRVARLMKDLAAETGASLLFISHDLSVVREVTDRVAVMNAGRIVEEGPVARVWRHPEHPYTARLLASIPKVDGLGVLPGDGS